MFRLTISNGLEIDATNYRTLEQAKESKEFLSRASGGKFDAIYTVCEAIWYAKSKVNYGEECSKISCRDHQAYPGAILSLHIGTRDKENDFSLDDFWMYPDPNYKGKEYPSSNFYGTVREFEEEYDEIYDR